MDYNTVIFDLDGTLLDTLQDLTDSMNHTMKIFGFPERTRQDVCRALGNGARHLVAELIPDGKENPVFEAFLKEYEPYYQQHCDIKTGPYEGLAAVLSRLKESGVKMAIVSNKGDGAVQELNRSYFQEFNMIAEGVRDGVRRKPAPDAVLEALKKLGSSLQESLYVGDTEVDFETAGNAGMACVLVSWGFRERSELEALGAVRLIDRPEELVSIVMGSSS